MTERLFIELLQVAVGKRTCLSQAPSEEEWERLYELAVKHAMLGVCFYAIQRLDAKEQVPSRQLLYQWYHVAEAIRHTNEVVNGQCKKLLTMLSQAGIRSSILKGQGVAMYYGDELSQYRQPGDIDVFVDCELEGALKFAHDNGQKVSHWDFKHLHLDIFDDTEVEVHYHVELLLNLSKNGRLQRWFEAHVDDVLGLTGGTEDSVETNGLTTPTLEFNMFYILLHIYRHFLYEGVGLRQLMDYYFVLSQCGVGEDRKEKSSSRYEARGTGYGKRIDVNDVLKSFGMTRFARGVMWVMQEVFELDEKYLFCEPLESEGRFILSEVMAGGNFGEYDERTAFKSKGLLYGALAICKHSLHLAHHYPSEVIWPPVWFVWHRCWKLRKKRKLGKLLSCYQPIYC